MLILGRRKGQSVCIILPDNQVIKMSVHNIKNNQVALSYDAPKDIIIDREEIHFKKLNDK